MNLFEDHERFAKKNASMARAFDVENRDKQLEGKGVSHLTGTVASCYNCKYGNKCKIFENLRTGGGKGSVSFGGTETKNFICDKYEPAKPKNPAMTDKQIKSLLKSAMSGRI